MSYFRTQTMSRTAVNDTITGVMVGSSAASFACLLMNLSVLPASLSWKRLHSISSVSACGSLPALAGALGATMRPAAKAARAKTTAWTFFMLCIVAYLALETGALRG